MEVLLCLKCDECEAFKPHRFQPKVCQRCGHLKIDHKPIDEVPERRRKKARKVDDGPRVTKAELKRQQEADEKAAEEEARRLEEEEIAEYKAVNKKIYTVMREKRFKDMIQMFDDDEYLDPDYEDPYGNTPLIVLCTYGCHRYIPSMFDFGADPNYENKFGVTPLIAACKSGSKKCIRELLDTSKGNPSAIILRPNKYLKNVMD